MSYNNNQDVIKLTMSGKSAGIFRGIIIGGIIVAIFCGIMLGITASSKPDMTSKSFSIIDTDDKFTVNLSAEKGQKLYLTIECTNPVDLKIVTDYDGNSYYKEEYYYTDLGEYIFKVPSTDVYTILIDYSDDASTGTLEYGVSNDNSSQKTGWTAGIFVSLFGGMIIALIYGGIADGKFRSQNR